MPLFHNACHAAFRLYVCCACPHHVLAVRAGCTVPGNHVSACLLYCQLLDLQGSATGIKGLASRALLSITHSEGVPQARQVTHKAGLTIKLRGIALLFVPLVFLLFLVLNNHTCQALVS